MSIARKLLLAAHAPKESPVEKMFSAQAKAELEAATRPPEPGRAGSGSHFLRAHYQKLSK